jgi:hypothetical protein
MGFSGWYFKLALGREGISPIDVRKLGAFSRVLHKL